MIWLCGDTHGEINIDKVEKFFLYESKVTKKDFLIILGDAGVCWDGGMSDDIVQDILTKLPCTVLWLDGNHENFDLIEEYPVKEWHGGKVQVMPGNLIHLMRGQVYDIDGHTFFIFGGGHSIDKMYRREHISWWPQEMPSKEEYEEGKKNLKKADWKVDYVLTHTCPHSIAVCLVTKLMKGEEELQDYLDWVRGNVDYKRWYFGHWHMDAVVKGEHQCLWQKIVAIPPKEEAARSEG